MAKESAGASGKTIGQLFRERVSAHGARTAIRSKSVDGRWTTTTWPEAERTVRALALALDDLGLERGDALAILANTREEWTYLDVAAMCIGLVVVGIYQSNLAESVTYILDDSDAKVLFVENDVQLAKVEPARAKLPKLKHVIGIEKSGAPKDGATFEALLARGAKLLAKEPKRFDALVDPVKPGDLATLVYTSGTTGMPKGAMLTHGNFSQTCEATRGVLEVRNTDSTVLFLPLAHIFARIIQFLCLERGILVAYPPPGAAPDQLFRCFEEVKPTFVASVPRLFEKVYSAANAQLAGASGVKKTIGDWAFRVGREASRRIQAGRKPGGLLGLERKIADRLVFRKIKARFGGVVRFFISGGAPLSREIQEWFHAADMLILEGFGLTETTAASCVNRPDKFRFGTVGLATPGTEVKIAEDGEILLRGVGVFKGYWKRAAETAQVVDGDGWFSTGDIGEIDADGFLRITDRKKDLIVTAGGKNIAPAYVESKLKTIPLLSQVMVHGDRRKFLTALVTLNPDEVKKLGIDYGAAVKSDKVNALVEQEIAARNRDLESFQQVKRFAILEKDFSIEDGTLTPTLKVKRKAITERWRPLLDSLYEDVSAAGRVPTPSARAGEPA